MSDFKPTSYFLDGSIVNRLIRMLEHPERKPDADGLYNDELSRPDVCGPDVEFVEGGGRLVVHHSLDGRELHEEDHDA